MSIRREDAVRRRLEALLEELAALPPAAPRVAPELPRIEALACLEAMFTSRLLDLEARELKNRGAGFYTIGSAGHEANAVLGRLLRPTDPCLLHYRSGALMAARLGREPGETFVWDTLLSLVASREDPVSAGRHKVWGSRRHWVPPQTSTIASHLPKAVGMAFSLSRAQHLRRGLELPDDAIVMCNFGDASVNHASASTAFNAASWATHQRLPVPLLFVCEDNGLGISVRTPETWIRDRFGHRRHIDGFECDGLDLLDSYRTAALAIEHVRRTRRPAFLHMRVVRLLGHAGSDVETLYRDEAAILAAEQRDPILSACRFLVERGYVSGAELLRLYERLQRRIARVAAKAVTRPRQTSAVEIARPLAFPAAERLRGEAQRVVSAVHDGPAARPRHMAMWINRALHELMQKYPEALLFGEDVAKKGGVYHVTAGLSQRFGVGRVFNTLLDETSILGLAIGAAQLGLLPFPEIQYLAYYHNAEDQLRGEACSQRFFSDGQWDNPMVVRIASLAYQKGFGGHFHNDNSIAVLRDVPGLVIGCPSRGDDAACMLRTLAAAAKIARSVCVFLEPIALLMEKDLYERGDNGWCFEYPDEGDAMEFGAPRSYLGESGSGERILVATYGNGVPMALRARRQLGAGSPRVDVLDLRWIAPLPVAAFLAQAAEADRVLVLDECRRSGGGIAEALLAAFAEDERTRGRPIRRITAHDSYVPLGDAANLVLPQVADVVEALRR